MSVECPMCLFTAANVRPEDVPDTFVCWNCGRPARVHPPGRSENVPAGKAYLVDVAATRSGSPYVKQLWNDARG